VKLYGGVHALDDAQRTYAMTPQPGDALAQRVRAITPAEGETTFVARQRSRA
jgi:hypothetical protein